MKKMSMFGTCMLMILLAPDGAAGTGTAAEFQSDEQTDNPVVFAEVTHSGPYRSIAVAGLSTPQPGQGLGGWFKGGWRGVDGYASSGGAGCCTGVFGSGGNSDTSNRGVHGHASGPDGSTNYGVWGDAFCSSGSCTTYGVYASGDLAYTGSLINASDLKFKESVEELEAGVSDLLELQVVKYRHKSVPEFSHINLPEGPQIGFIAQQVAEIMPNLVVEAVHPPKQDEESGRDVSEPIRYQALKTVQLIPVLVKAIQEQQAQIEALTAQIAPLKNRLAQLERGDSATTVATVSP